MSIHQPEQMNSNATQGSVTCDDMFVRLGVIS